MAAKQQGWIRQKFDPFLKDLEAKGFEFDPGVVVRTLALVGHGSARLRDVPATFWEVSDTFDEHWRKAKEAISSVVRNLMEYGVLSSNLLPSLNVLIPVFLLRAQFPRDFSFPEALRWLLVATRYGRYSGSALTVLDQDSRQIRSKASFVEAIKGLSDQLSVSGVFSADDFREEYTGKFMRLILYLIVFDRKAHDWINQDVRIGFDREDNELNEGFKLEWHHVFPRKVVRGRFDDSLVDSLANIAVLNEKANRAFSGKLPRQYLEKHGVAADRLEEQAVPDAKSLDVDRFEEFLQHRSEELARRATDYLQTLAT